MLIPGEIFRTYARDLIRVEVAKSRIILLNVLKRKLWASAAFDSYIVGQYKKPLLDGFGLPVEEAGEYAQIIQQALQEYKMGRQEYNHGRATNTVISVGSRSIAGTR